NDATSWRTGGAKRRWGEELGADSLRYLSMSGLVEAIGLPESDLCVGCLTGHYPMGIPQEHRRFQRALTEF
ncbi:hypothetical protein B1B_18766, partial [mine drainage metagenome]